MAALQYREDMDDVRTRLTAWWSGIDIGRPALLLTAPRETPVEQIKALPEPEGWITHYSTRDFAYRLNCGLRACINTHYFAEAVPFVSPDLAPNCLALFLGCHGVEMPETVWCEPCIASPEEARFAFDPANAYWDFSYRLGQELMRHGKGKFLVAFPDLIEGLDTLAAMRGSEQLLQDLYERPDWVQACLRAITERYFECYDALYGAYQDEAGGSVFWAWAPGRMAKLQCDLSAMISPDMFGEFMVPVLRDMTQRLAHSMYHWDGPSALRHHDHLLSIPALDMLQWTPGAGVEPPDHPRWWPYYHKTIDAGKRVYVHTCENQESLAAMKREFGTKLQAFMIGMGAGSPRQAETILSMAEV